MRGRKPRQRHVWNLVSGGDTPARYTARSGTTVTTHWEHVDGPTNPFGDPIWDKRDIVIVTGDLFSPDVPLDFITSAFAAMNQSHVHSFEVLTKHSDRLRDVSRYLSWTPNIFLGLLVELPKFTNRLDHLRETPACQRYVIVDALRGRVRKMSLRGIAGVMMERRAAETAKKRWIWAIRRRCMIERIPFWLCPEYR